jgi:hypothetical protein
MDEFIQYKPLNYIQPPYLEALYMFFYEHRPNLINGIYKKYPHFRGAQLYTKDCSICYDYYYDSNSDSSDSDSDYGNEPPVHECSEHIIQYSNLAPTLFVGKLDYVVFFEDYFEPPHIRSAETVRTRQCGIRIY